MIVELTRDQVDGDAFLELLREAAGRPDPILLRIRDTELAGLTVRGLVRSGDVIAFAAWDATAEPTVLEYIAVDANHRSTGLGRALIDGIRRSRPSTGLLADTDDDAVDFYRRLGFAIAALPRDARWPDRPRYRCTLRPLGLLGDFR